MFAIVKSGKSKFVDWLESCVSIKDSYKFVVYHGYLKEKVKSQHQGFPTL